MFKYLFLFCFGLLAHNACLAQYFIAYDGEGKLVTNPIYSNVEGSPYLFDNWLPGTATTVQGKVFDSLKIKYDVYDEMLIFIYKDTDQPLKFADPIKNFTINNPDLRFSNGFPAIDKQTDKSYYQIVSQGKLTLLKRNIKLIKDHKDFNSASTTRNIIDDALYYVYRDGRIAQLKKSRNNVMEAMADKGSQVSDFLNSNSINFKKEQDLQKLFDYYNSL